MLLTIKYKKGNRVWIGRAADREKNGVMCISS